MELRTTREKLDAWTTMDSRTRPFVQDFFPELNEDEREFLISGVTPEEWAKLFPPGEDEEEGDDESCFP